VIRALHEDTLNQVCHRQTQNDQTNRLARNQSQKIAAACLGCDAWQNDVLFESYQSQNEMMLKCFIQRDHKEYLQKWKEKETTPPSTRNDLAMKIIVPWFEITARN